jgi:hypothetical protein
MKPGQPTGKIFVRFAEHVDAASREKDIASAGYKIVKTLPWAPHAAWVEPETSLAQLEDLKALRDMENVEPQMFMERSKRT